MATLLELQEGLALLQFRTNEPLDASDVEKVTATGRATGTKYVHGTQSQDLNPEKSQFSLRDEGEVESGEEGNLQGEYEDYVKFQRRTWRAQADAGLDLGYNEEDNPDEQQPFSYKEMCFFIFCVSLNYSNCIGTMVYGGCS